VLAVTLGATRRRCRAVANGPTVLVGVVNLPQRVARDAERVDGVTSVQNIRRRDVALVLRVLVRLAVARVTADASDSVRCRERLGLEVVVTHVAIAIVRRLYRLSRLYRISQLYGLRRLHRVRRRRDRRAARGYTPRRDAERAERNAQKTRGEDGRDAQTYSQSFSHW